jgi:hypothetical protein
MVLRWMAQGFVEAEKRFRRIRGYREIPLLIQALVKTKNFLGGRRWHKCRRGLQ